MVQGAPPPSPGDGAPEPAAATRTSGTAPFSPVPLLATLGGLAASGAVAWFVPGLRSAVTGLLSRGSH